MAGIDPLKVVQASPSEERKGKEGFSGSLNPEWCYGLNICVLPNLNTFKPNPKCDGIRRGFGHELS